MIDCCGILSETNDLFLVLRKLPLDITLARQKYHYIITSSWHICLPQHTYFIILVAILISHIGGDEENRTPVRNPFNKSFYECSR